MIEKEDVVENGTGDVDRAGDKNVHCIRWQIPPAVVDPDEVWVKEYIEQFGDSPSFF